MVFFGVISVFGVMEVISVLISVGVFGMVWIIFWLWFSVWVSWSSVIFVVIEMIREFLFRLEVISLSILIMMLGLTVVKMMSAICVIFCVDFVVLMSNWLWRVVILFGEGVYI